MFTLTYEQLIRDPDFSRALRALGELKALPGSLGYNIAKIRKAVVDEAKIVQELFEKGSDEFLQKDKDGNHVPARDGAGNIIPGEVVVKPEAVKPMNEWVKSFMRNTVEIKRPKLRLEDVAKELTPNQIMALEPLWEPVKE